MRGLGEHRARLFQPRPERGKDLPMTCWLVAQKIMYLEGCGHTRVGSLHPAGVCTETAEELAFSGTWYMLSLSL